MKPLLLMIGIVALVQDHANSADFLGTYDPRPVTLDITLSWPVSSVATKKGDLLILDKDNHRIVVLGPDGHMLRQIGHVGNSEGQLFHPSALTVGADDHAYVVDQDNCRVQVLDSSDGRVVGVVPIGLLTDTIAVNGRGEVLLNSPMRGHLVTVYSAGGAVKREFGTLVSRSEGYPNRSLPPGVDAPFNRAHLIYDYRDDSVYVILKFMPVVQRYDSAGTLIWSVRLHGKEIDDLERSFWQDPGAKPRRSVQSLDGVGLMEFVTGAGTDSRGNLILATSDRNLLFVSTNGHYTGWKKPQQMFEGVFRSVSVLNDAMVFVSPFGVYRETDRGY